MSVVLDAVGRELANARRVHSGAIHSAHEGYAVILEELDEAWDEVRADRLGALADELVQVAAMCVRTIEDLGLEWKVGERP